MKKMIFLNACKILMASLGLAIALPLIAADTGQINYQARLLDSYGRRVNDTVDLSFKIYDAVSAGNLLWSETQSDVVVQDGVYSVVLGSQTAIPASVFAQNSVYLELGINGETMSPRQQITASAYSLVARSIMGSNIYENQTSGYVGVGTTNPAVKLDVSGTVQATGIKIPTGASPGYLLASDGNGIGTWQAFSSVITESDPLHTNWVRMVYTPATNSIWGAIGAEAATRAADDIVLQNNIDTSSNALNASKLNLSGGIMTGSLTNNGIYGGFFGDGGGLTNISSSGVSLTGVVHRIGDTMTGPLIVSNNVTITLTNRAGYFVATNSITLGGMTISNWNSVSGGNLTNDLIALQGATGTLNTSVGTLNASTNTLQIQAIALQGATNTLNSATNALQVQAIALQGATNTLNSATNALQVQAIALQGATNTLNSGSISWNNAVIMKQVSGSLAYSNLYYLASGPTWSNASASTNTTAKGLLGLALGSSGIANGLLLNGSFTNVWGFAPGAILYMGTNNNQITETIPTGTNQVVRIIGYTISTTNIYFNPDRTYIEILGQ